MLGRFSKKLRRCDRSCLRSFFPVESPRVSDPSLLTILNCFKLCSAFSRSEQQTIERYAPPLAYRPTDQFPPSAFRKPCRRHSKALKRRPCEFKQSSRSYH